MGNILSETQIGRYRHDGYLFPFPALSAAELADCRAGLARFEEWLDQPVNDSDKRWRSAPYIFMPWADALAHLLDGTALLRAYNRQRENAAVDVDGITKEVYGPNLLANLQDWHERLKTQR